MIDLNDFPENELELMVFSDSEPELEYLPKPKSFIYPVIFLLGAAFIEADIHTFLYLIFFNL